MRASLRPCGSAGRALVPRPTARREHAIVMSGAGGMPGAAGLPNLRWQIAARARAKCLTDAEPNHNIHIAIYFSHIENIAGGSPMPRFTAVSRMASR